MNIHELFENYTDEIIMYFGLQDEEPTAPFYKYALLYNAEH
jgi:hypothetical protein